ncbi:hypothetical protein ACHHYP_12729 [Achlya hypogyna]|uniref:Uncharacterized protein n=1 Tax=Achlya hypogyna TaxID=1202772 RepID=A0A1V9ZGX6_ACHHY|nr:hypothetical protein ACHHYP_12729 [Achlya hypogyna]
MSESRFPRSVQDEDDDALSLASSVGEEAPPTIGSLTEELQRSRNERLRASSDSHFRASSDDVDKIIARRRSELHEIKERKRRARGNPILLSLDDLEGHSAPPSLASSRNSGSFSSPPKALDDITRRVSTHEQRLRSDRMRLADLSSADLHRHTKEPHSPTRSQRLLGQKAIHKWHPSAKRTQVPNEETPLDIILSSSDYGGDPTSVDDDAITATQAANRRLRALLDMDRDEPTEPITDADGSPTSDGEAPQPRTYADLQRKMDEMNRHLEQLQKEKRDLERNQLDAERNAVDMSSSLRLLSAQVSQFLNHGDTSMRSQEPQNQSQYIDDILEEIRLQRKCVADVQSDVARWQHDADLLEQGRVLELKEQHSQLLHLGASTKLLDEKTEGLRDQVRVAVDDYRSVQKKLALVWSRLEALETTTTAHEAALRNTGTGPDAPLPPWLVPTVLVLAAVVGLQVVGPIVASEGFWLWLCAVLGYECIVT